MWLGSCEASSRGPSSGCAGLWCLEGEETLCAEGDPEICGDGSGGNGMLLPDVRTFLVHQRGQ